MSNLDQTRLRPHLRKTPTPTPTTEAPLWEPDRKGDPWKLRGVGITGTRTGTPGHFIREAAGAGDLTWWRQRERTRQKALGEYVDPAEVLERSNRQCYLCGCRLTPRTMQLEHIAPLSRGGTHTTANILAACQSCNYRKGTRYVAFMVTSRKPTYLPS